MKKLSPLILTLFSLLIFYNAFGQDYDKYDALIKEAWNDYQNREYLKSGERYTEAFAALNGKGTLDDRYNAACSWALAGQPDSAFIQLFKIAQHGNYINLDHITFDTDLNPLHQYERWTKVIEIVKSNKEKAEANFDKPIVQILDSIYYEDQFYRQQIDAIIAKYGRDSDEMRDQWKLLKKKDSLNLFKVRKILDERGWLGTDIIGEKGNLTLFLVIQHSSLETQQKYLPMMREAVQNGDARSADLALLEDRVAIGQGEKQIYGSQVGQDKETGEYYVLPLSDPENVDKRRAEVGLESLADYLSNWGLTWNIEEYKKRLPIYEMKLKAERGGKEK